ncbi:aspartate aminotransferase family protein [Stigmatella erecta]|uniref:4-aminobutyrate aminotransferase n=1 Tax=Stigmatella erecta TaxID=83460 RepID=A0A1I0JF87_9BACT|nr:aminotransferase class III-fold pyridoxal phosphate-dependent enzyme [Stigmatella erecta]SEU08043.1 4-aminobutyrate aminotransferase [Stigmatella erecta]
MTVPPPFYYETGDIVLTEGAGVRVRTRDGREFLDCISGTFNLLLGHNHPEVMAAAKAQMDRLVHTGSSYLSEPVEQLAQALVGLAPANLSRVHLRSAGGSTANEGAIRIAQHVTGKRDVITMFRSHLGQTMATIGYSGFAFHRAPFPYVMPGALHVPEPSCSRCFYGQKAEHCELPCVSRIDDFIRYASSGSVACVLIEPIFGVGGNIVPPPRYFPELKRFCEERGIVLIFDEIQTGFGRTGEMFAANYFGVAPHMMTLSKGLTGSGFPLGAILTEERLMGMPRIHHGFTGGGNAVASAAAVKTVEIVSRPGFLPHVRQVGTRLREGLARLAPHYPFIGEVRGVGLMLGLEVVGPRGEPAPARALGLQASLMRQGLMTRVSEHGRGHVIEIRPALVITEKEVDELLARFGEACHALA